MTTPAQIRGMLLEEAVLYLLQSAGYRIVDDGADDQTIVPGRSGLEVMGRGGRHQIDAIADFEICPPLSYPQRLLVEAKCYSERKPVGLEVVQNAVGVLNDVQQNGTARDGTPLTNRHHYQYAVFSASGFTSNAEQYAYAHDICLFPLANSKFIQPILQAIRVVDGLPWGLSETRQVVREQLRNPQSYQLTLMADGGHIQSLQSFVVACQAFKQCAIAMIQGQFPIFLVPAPGLELTDILTLDLVTIHWDADGWYLRSRGADVFSFDLPFSLFSMYADRGDLAPLRALDLKQERLSRIQAFTRTRRGVKVITLRLDRRWLDQVRARLIEAR